MNGDLYQREVIKDHETVGFIPISSIEKPTMKTRIACYMKQFDDEEAATYGKKKF